jgi:NAD(P)-dependent dehydrogenase (short-subunit alcohol dehydrogenase family)
LNASHQLDGKRVVITGAAGGMGSAAVHAFLREGARVFAVERRGGRPLDPGAVGQNRVTRHAADLSDLADAGAVIDCAATSLGGVDVVVNLAGVVDRFQSCGAIELDVWARTIAVNLTAPMLLCRAALPRMVEQGHGRIVNVASIAGVAGSKGGAAYTAAKHGLVGLTKNIAVTYAPDGIVAVCVCPGGVATGLGFGGEPDPRGVAALQRAIPSRPRNATPEEFAHLLVAIASDAGSFLNGTVLVADGGWHAY